MSEQGAEQRAENPALNQRRPHSLGLGWEEGPPPSPLHTVPFVNCSHLAHLLEG